MSNYPALNDFDYDELVFRAEGYAIYYATHHPGEESPLSGEWSDSLTPVEMLANIGVSREEITTDDEDGICEAFEGMYHSQDTNDRKHPDCICPTWDYQNRVEVAAETQCPAHDSDAWEAHVATTDQKNTP